MGLIDRILNALFGSSNTDDLFAQAEQGEGAKAESKKASPGVFGKLLTRNTAGAFAYQGVGRSPRGGGRNGPLRSLPRSVDGEPERLALFGLPNIETGQRLAEKMGLSMKRLVFLADMNRATLESTLPAGSQGRLIEWKKPIRHYRIWRVKKRSGGERVLQAPLRDLKRAQRWICRAILDHVPPHDAAHAYEKRRSVATNAKPHTKQAVVVALDLVDFFPTITFRRVRGVFRELGYSKEVALYLALLSTTAEQPDGVGRYRFAWRRRLPQGAPTSPQLSNLVCRRLDRRLAGLARAFGANYTRYADDITFSGDVKFRAQLSKFLKIVGKIIEREGFQMNWEKRRIMRPSGRQRVTGVVVNERPTLSRAERRMLRAIAHRTKHGKPVTLPAGKSADPDAYVQGRLAYLAMIDPHAADAIRQRM